MPMVDMLVRLYALPDGDEALARLSARDVTVRRPMSYERHVVVRWIDAHFNPLWASECETAFSRHPFDCHIAVQADRLIGFCCVNCTFPNFLGPIGVLDSVRGSGVGGALLLTALHDLKNRGGYAYAIVGDAGQPGFFEKVAGAVQIDGSAPGAYPPRLKR